MGVAAQYVIFPIYRRGVFITYDSFIEKILSTRGRFNCGDSYHERHHIIPKSCGGTDDKYNLIDLFAKEHFIAHKLLAEEHPDNEKLVFAYSMMAFPSNQYEHRYELIPEEYEAARVMLSETVKAKYKDKKNHPCYGTHISEERKRIISEANKGNKYCLGRKISDETRRKIGKANKNPSQETRDKMSKARKGRGLGGENPNAKTVVRLSDGKVYGCMKDAAKENMINCSTLRCLIQNKTKFSYYTEQLH